MYSYNAYFNGSLNDEEVRNLAETKTSPGLTWYIIGGGRSLWSIPGRDNEGQTEGDVFGVLADHSFQHIDVNERYLCCVVLYLSILSVLSRDH